jgi:hypothetical protein
MQSVDLLAPRYRATMKPFYILATSMGETLYGLFDSFLGFLSWRQVQQYRDSQRKVLGLREDILSLSLENFRSLARRYMPDSSDARVCLAVDAAFIKPTSLLILAPAESLGWPNLWFSILTPLMSWQMIRMHSVVFSVIVHIASRSFRLYYIRRDSIQGRRLFRWQFCHLSKGRQRMQLFSPFLKRDRF